MSITDRARDRAEKIVRNARVRIGLTDREADLYRDGFTAGARWAASLPPTDEEVEAASRAFYEGIDGLTNWDSLVRASPDIADRYRTGVRRALTTAREAQR